MTSELLLRFTHILRQALKLAPEQGVLAAVSGGRDSVVLAHLLKEAGQNFAIAHVHYGLRGAESDRDAAFVASLAKELEVPFFEKRLDPADFQVNLQEKAREARYQWFETLCKEEDYGAVMLAHHEQDQAETVLMALLRGRGSKSVAGMQLQNGKRLRPLLGFLSTELASYAHEAGLSWVEDSSNRETDYDRNYLRLVIKPKLDERFPQWEQMLSRQALQWQQLQQLLNAQSRSFAEQVIQINQPHWHQWRLQPLKTLPYADLIIGALARPYGLGQQLTELLIALQHLPVGKQLVAGKWLITRSSQGFDWFQPGAVTSVSIKIEGLGSYRLPAGELEVATGADFDDSWEQFDEQVLKFPLQIRTWQEGDRLSPLGMFGTKKLSDLFNEAKWSAYQKATALVLADENRIYWVVGLRRSTFALRKATTRGLVAFKIKHD